MAQFGRPDSNVTQTDFNGGFAEIDEATPSDADFAWSNNSTVAVLEVGLSDITDPQGNTNHTFRYRIAQANNGVVDGSGTAVTITAELIEGTTVIASDVARTATGTWTLYAFTLSTAQADAITDYANLRLRFTTGGGGGSPSARRGGAISWAELEAPDVGGGGGAPTLISATMDDTGRNYETFEQDLVLTFSVAVEITPAPNLGDIIDGLTVDVDFSSFEDFVRYVSGNGTTEWTVRITNPIAAEVYSNAVVFMDYVPATGNILAVDNGVELTGFTDTEVTNNLTKVIWERIKNKDGVNLNAVEVQYALFEGGIYDPTNVSWMVLEQKGTLITTADGIVKFAYTGSATPGSGGGDKYLAILHPNADPPSESLIWLTRVR